MLSFTCFSQNFRNYNQCMEEKAAGIVVLAVFQCVECECTVSRNIRTMQSQSKEDELALSNLLEEKQLFLAKALKNYILCLHTGVWMFAVTLLHCGEILCFRMIMI